MRCCTRDEGWPFGAALRGEASNRLMLRWLKTVVVSDEEKASRRRQVGTGKTTIAEASKVFRRHQNRGVVCTPGRVGRVTAYWPGGVRWWGGVRAVGCCRRGRGVRGSSVGSTGVPGRSQVEELKSSGKPFDISKSEVWDAWIKVKENQGAS